VTGAATTPPPSGYGYNGYGYPPPSGYGYSGYGYPPPSGYPSY
jgi:hypothetical protein